MFDVIVGAGRWVLGTRLQLKGSEVPVTWRVSQLGYRIKYPVLYRNHEIEQQFIANLF
jgi:hypothetical protein